MSKSSKGLDARDYLIVMAIWLPVLVGFSFLVKYFFLRLPADVAEQYYLPAVCAAAFLGLAGMLIDLGRRRHVPSPCVETDTLSTEVVEERVHDAQRKMLLDLVKAELEFQSIYNRFAELYPGNADFWKELSEDEYNHADVLSGLEKQLTEGAIFWNLGHFHSKAMKNHLKLTEETSSKADDPNLPEYEAFHLAFRIESSLVDSKFYEVVASDATEFKYVAEAMLAAERKHVQKLCDRITALGDPDPSSEESA